MTLVFTQKQVRTQATFEFGATELTYTLRINGCDIRQVVDYFEIHHHRRHTTTPHWNRLQLGLVLGVLAACVVVAQLRLGGASPALALWFAPSVACLGLFAFMRSHFVEVQAAGQPVWIIDDKTKHNIVAEIDRRRRDRLADIYGALNLANDPAMEIRKVDWLVEQSVLTRDQADLQIAKVAAAADARRKALEDAAAAAPADLFGREAIAV